MIFRAALFCSLCTLAACASNTKPGAERGASSTEKKAGTQAVESNVSVGPFGLTGEGKLRATIITTDGNLDCELFEKEAPNTVKNFVTLGMGKKDWKDPKTGQTQNKPFYAGLQFFRIVPGFFLQSGDPTNTGSGGPGYVFDDEFSDKLVHDKPGILSMANQGPNTNGSQFFVLLKPTPHLNGHHSVFGHCDNLEVIQKLASHPVNSENMPGDPPKILSIEFARGE